MEAPSIEEYDRMFRVDNVPFLINNVWIDYYKTLEVISLHSGDQWLSHLPKRNLERIRREAKELFSNKDVWEKFKKDWYEFMDKSKGFFRSIIEKDDITQEETEKMLDILTEVFFYYSKTEFIYSDPAYELKDDPIVAEHLKEFEKLKTEAREYLNEVFFGKECLVNLVMKVLAKKLEVAKEDLDEYNREELLLAFDGEKVQKGLLEERKKAYWTDGKNKEINIAVGDEALRIIKDFLGEEKEEKVKGMIANRGKVKGRVYVLMYKYNTFDDFARMAEEMEEGDVLVAETTSPELIQACHKASAIVTNQGGMMSHAAIFSREFGIPCIVGTGNATDVLKTGDVVEVNADEGVVRKMDKEEYKEIYTRPISLLRVEFLTKGEFEGIKRLTGKDLYFCPFFHYSPEKGFTAYYNFSSEKEDVKPILKSLNERIPFLIEEFEKIKRMCAELEDMIDKKINDPKKIFEYLTQMQPFSSIGSVVGKLPFASKELFELFKKYRYDYDGLAYRAEKFLLSLANVEDELKEHVNILGFEELFEGKPSNPGRSKGFVYYKGKIHDKELGQFLDENNFFVNEQIVTKKDTIKGTPACGGVAKGTVKKVFTKADFDKVNEGDILVTSMTIPDFLPVMKKAAAFVTDEGGVTCHAAIIAREMKKPCIIGTKIATKVLNDGDEVEVDADEGVVR
ncbi:PEP-utilizing enzyme [Nanoarchaeota archaeon]